MSIYFYIFIHTFKKLNNFLLTKYIQDIEFANEIARRNNGYINIF